MTTSAPKARERLREGNRRFVSNTRRQSTLADHSRRAELVRSQQPFAIILSCSDSRVPPEIVFDQGLGDLFVVRVAGNIAGPTQVGSIEFAAARFGVRLVVVLGHSRCGAILATLEHLTGAAAPAPSRGLAAIVDAIRPSVEPLLKTEPSRDRDGLVRQAARANVGAAVDRLRRSEILERLIENDGLRVVGAAYSLETGRVEFFDDAEAG